MPEYAFPAADPIPLPAPVWIFKFLHLLTLATHFYAVEFLLGGLFIATLWNLFARALKSPAAVDASGVVSHRLPVVVAYVINLGVPPLLFSQVLYGRALYTSSVVMGVWWISVVFLLMAGYFLLYQMAKRAESNRAWGWLGIIAYLILAKIAMIYSANMTLMLRPEVWREMYAASPQGGFLPSGDPTVLARWLFMVVGAVGLSGMAMALLGLKKTLAPETAQFLRRWGGALGALFTGVQVILGFYVLSTQPEEVREALMGSAVYKPIALGWLGAQAVMALLGLGVWATAAKRTPLLPWAMAAVSAVSMGLMVVFRDGIVNVTLGLKGFDVWASAVQTNWNVVILFFVLLVLAVAFLAWMVWVLAKARGERETYA